MSSKGLSLFVVLQVRAVMSSNDVMSPFVATSVAVPAGSSICNNVTHTVTWSITNDRLIIRVDNNVHEEFPFNGFTPCRDLNVPLYLGGVKGQSLSTSFVVFSHRSTFNVLAFKSCSKYGC